MNGQANDTPRLEGLDLARFLALAGMVIVNFNVVMVSIGDDGGRFSGIASLLQGRAAATFVVLAGLGLGLGAARYGWDRTLSTTTRRAAFLLLVGLLNLAIFEADIIHYYAFYFLFGVLFLRQSNRIVSLSIAGLVAGFVVLLIILDYDAGWDWQTYTYSNFWTLEGFVRNLLFNGWHPLVPWLAFFLFGILLSRLNLDHRAVKLRLLFGGCLMLAAVTFASHKLMHAVAAVDAESAVLFSTEPIPPTPLYMLAGGSAACAVIALCLLSEARLRALGLLQIFAAAGRQTLTLYVAHIVLGMGTLEALGMLGGQDAQSSLIAAAIFMLIATGYTLVWTRFFRRGPLETIMRRVSG